jgi:glycosyltransferase involved in cell wall biosynthesis
MKILCVTPWQNTWVSYWTDYIKSRGHDVDWYIDNNLNKIKEKMDRSDVVLSMWADKYTIGLSKLNAKPLYVILRSYEVFTHFCWADLKLIKWDNVKQLFMLNESHYHMFKRQVKDVKPIFIKNGVDLEEWQSNGVLKSRNKIAFIANINEKKGIELLVQSIHELCKVNPKVHLEHLGGNQDLRRCYYLNTVMPKLKGTWFNTEYKNDHGFVKKFLADKKFIISTSIAEGNPMNLIEAMSLKVIPLVHTWPGASLQFPKECLWTTFDELRDIYQKLDSDPEAPMRMRRYAEDYYDYRKNFKVVIDKIEEGVKCGL